jgi:anti-anti-sigma factor
MDGLSGPVRLDLSAVGFMDSTGLRLILQRLASGPITLVSPTPQILRLFELCGLTHVAGLSFEPEAN